MTNEPQRTSAGRLMVRLINNYCFDKRLKILTLCLRGQCVVLSCFSSKDLAKIKLQFIERKLS